MRLKGDYAPERGGAVWITLDPQTPPHFALMCAHGRRPEGILDEITGAGVRPILYEDHGKVPLILERAYLSVFQNHQIPVPREGVGVELLNPAAVWKMLILGKRWEASSREQQEG